MIGSQSQVGWIDVPFSVVITVKTVAKARHCSISNFDNSSEISMNTKSMLPFYRRTSSKSKLLQGDVQFAWAAAQNVHKMLKCRYVAICSYTMRHYSYNFFDSSRRPFSRFLYISMYIYYILYSIYQYVCTVAMYIYIIYKQYKYIAIYSVCSYILLICIYTH